MGTPPPFLPAPPTFSQHLTILVVVTISSGNQSLVKQIQFQNYNHSWTQVPIISIFPSLESHKTFFFFFFGILGFELRASCLLGRWLYHLSHPPALFCIGYFQDRVSRTVCPWLASNCDPPGLCLLSS
jgi:hypothetical protein